MKWYVKICAFESKDVIPERVGPYYSEREADRADRGVNINLNHDKYYTTIEAEEG